MGTRGRRAGRARRRVAGGIFKRVVGYGGLQLVQRLR